MKQTKGAIGNLLNRYRAVLKKCHLLNTFGSLAVAGMLIMGGASVALAVDGTWTRPDGTQETWSAGTVIGTDNIVLSGTYEELLAIRITRPALQLSITAYLVLLWLAEQSFVIMP